MVRKDITFKLSQNNSSFETTLHVLGDSQGLGLNHCSGCSPKTGQSANILITTERVGQSIDYIKRYCYPCGGRLIQQLSSPDFEIENKAEVVKSINEILTDATNNPPPQPEAKPKEEAKQIVDGIKQVRGQTEQEPEEQKKETGSAEQTQTQPEPQQPPPPQDNKADDGEFTRRQYCLNTECQTEITLNNKAGYLECDTCKVFVAQKLRTGEWNRTARGGWIKKGEAQPADKSDYLMRELKDLEKQAQAELFLRPEGERFSVPLNKVRPKNDEELAQTPPNSIVFPPKDESKKTEEQVKGQPASQQTTPPPPQSEQTQPKNDEVKKHSDLSEEDKKKLEEIKKQVNEQAQQELNKELEGKSGLDLFADEQDTPKRKSTAELKTIIDPEGKMSPREYHLAYKKWYREQQKLKKNEDEDEDENGGRKTGYFATHQPTPTTEKPEDKEVGEKTTETTGTPPTTQSKTKIFIKPANFEEVNRLRNLVKELQAEKIQLNKDWQVKHREFKNNSEITYKNISNQLKESEREKKVLEKELQFVYNENNKIINHLLIFNKKQKESSIFISKLTIKHAPLKKKTNDKK